MRSQGRNFFLDDCEGEALDVYEGWVAVRGGRYWYRARIAPGFVSLVDFTKPNEHTRLIRKDDLDKVRRDDTVDALPFEGSPYVLLGPQILDLSEYDLATIRFGRTGTIGEKPFWIVDGFGEEASIARGVFGDASADLPVGA